MTNAAGAVRTVRDAVITGRCIDCGETFTGEIGIRVIGLIAGPGLEIVVANPKRNEIHAIARVELHLIPFVVDNVVPLPPAGSA
jgi:hypothetical protein